MGDLESMLRNRGIAQLVVTGVTTEVCVNTTVREANDRGYDCLVDHVIDMVQWLDIRDAACELQSRIG